MRRLFKFSPPAPDARPVVAPEVDIPFSSDPRILVADDNPAALAEACELLSQWGITPAVAMDGAEAVALACSREFDLILMDLQMPVLDGLTATKKIRVCEQERSSARAAVLAYTSCALADDVLRNCGLDGALTKPCSAPALRECLVRWCAQGRTVQREA
jgi:CheY-like chemotaxis protein